MLSSSSTRLCVRERQKALLRTNWVGAVWNGFLLGGVRGQPVPCRFCGKAVGDGPHFGKCPNPPLVDTRENPECHDLMRMDKRSLALGVSCGVDGVLHILGVNGVSPWAESAAEGVSNLLECCMASYSSRLLLEWDVPDEFGRDDSAQRVPASPNVWTHGSLVLDEVSGATSAGSGALWIHVGGFVLFLDPADSSEG